jgi:RNA polymerase-binding transcription factor DksA
VIALHATEELEALRAQLEEQYEGHTERLAQLLVPQNPRRGREGRGGNPAATAAALSASRRALAEVARALQRMAEGTYGRCERCTETIPVAHLELRPTDRFCPSCH